MINPVIIFGAKGLAKVALDIFKSNGIEVYCFLDDDLQLHNTEIGEVSVLGATDDDGYLKLIGKKCDAFVACDDTKERIHYVELLNERRSIMPINAIHKSAIISSMASIGHGNFISANVVVNAGAQLGNHLLVNAGVIIENDTILGDFVQLGTGAIVSSGAVIEEGAFIGSGAVIVGGVTIGKNARVGAGSVVIQSVAAKATVFGNPAAKPSF